MEAVIASFSLPISGTYGVYCNPCANGDAVGALVRLPFHDAVGGGRPSGKGGANGCIDWSFAGNNGLQEVTSALNATYFSGGFSELLSLADFWVLAGNAAVRVASTLPSGKIPEGGLPMPQGPLELPFRYGREDDASCDGVDAAFLPSVQMGYAGTAAIFTKRIGMTPRQLVAVMGAHTLGRAQGVDSGFDGSWSGYSSSFSIAYYWQLLGVQVGHPPPA
jgi:L-ascorbate peroxidase